MKMKFTFRSTLKLILVLSIGVSTKAQFLSNQGRLPNTGTNFRSIQVIETSPPNGKIVKQGDTVTLSCVSNIEWFFCVWKSPGGGKQCAIQDTDTKNLCSDDQRITLRTQHNKCEIELKNAQPEDRGQWLCFLNDLENLGSDKSSIDIDIAVPAQIRFDSRYGDKGILRVTEGNEVEIRCAATGGFPAPQLSWSEPANAIVDISAEPEIVTSTNGHTIDVYHSIKYRADLRDNNTVFTCLATQLDLNGKDVLYESLATVRLRVDKIVLPPVDNNALTQKIGIISGALLGIIFLILIIVFVSLLVCKRRRKRSRPPSSQATDDTSPETHSSVIKPIWTTDRGMVTSPIKGLKNEEVHYQRSRHHHSNINERPLISQTLSQRTVSTQSTASQGSWEEDRSVGGEIEDSSTQRILPPPLLPRAGAKTPSLHETHFDSELDLPRTVVHHPDPYQLYQNTHQLIPYRTQQYLHQKPAPSGTLGRPSSSMAAGEPWHQSPCTFTGPGTRPVSALGGPGSYDTLGSRKMPTSNGTLTTSVKSVFDCELGCFAHEDGFCEEQQALSQQETLPVSGATTLQHSALEPREV